MSIDVKKTIQDAGYVTVGIGVIATQQAQVKRRSLSRKLRNTARETGDFVKGQASDAATTIDTQAKEISLRARDKARSVQDSVVNSSAELIDRTQPIVEEVRNRLEPLAAQLQGVPDQLARVIESGRDRVQKVTGRAA